MSIFEGGFSGHDIWGGAVLAVRRIIGGSFGGEDVWEAVSAAEIPGGSLSGEDILGGS